MNPTYLATSLLASLLVGCNFGCSSGMIPSAIHPWGQQKTLMIWANVVDSTNQHGWHGRPSVAHGLVFIRVAGGIAAFQTTTGRMVWRDTLPTIFHTLGEDNITVAGALVCIGDGDAVCVRASDGALVWRYAPHDTVSDLATTSASNTTFFVGLRTSGAVVGLDLATGHPRWTADLRRGAPLPLFIFGISVSGDTVYVGTDQWITVFGGISHGSVYALDARTGHEIWHYQTPGNHGNIAGAPIVTDRLLVVNDVDAHVLIALNRADGHEVWRTAMPLPGGGHVTSEHAPIVYRDTVYAGSRDTHVYAIDLETGRVLWDHARGGSINYIAACGNKILSQDFGIIVTDRGTHQNVRAPSGTTVSGDMMLSAFAVENDTAFVTSTKAVYAIDCTIQ